MKHTAKEYHFWKNKTTNKAVGKVVDIVGNDSIDNYVEVELPEPLKKLSDMIREWLLKHGKQLTE